MNRMLCDFDIVEPDEDDLLPFNLIVFGVPRQIYQRNHYFETMDASTFRKRFRLSKEIVLLVLTEIEHNLQFPLDTNNCVLAMDQLLTCLRLYSTGGHLDSIADFAGMHFSTVSRIVVRVSEALASLSRNYICAPHSENDKRKTQQDFFNIAAFPKVIGTIDCSHFKIMSPGGNDPEIFRNRKGYFSINAQFICDANLKILNTVARWPGSCHDNTIFNSSAIKQQFENNRYRGCFLLGDSGYANNTYLMTPLLNPVTDAEQLYNESHIRTRNCVERLFGVLKRRFPILAYGCRLKLETFMTIIVAASVLHNIAIINNDEAAPPLPEELDDHNLNQMIENGQIPNLNFEPRENMGAVSRNVLINQYFQNRL